ncbi:unnamed protein product [Phytophthora fragariaefolia]|uniref:Unnamed protein product n=1 Tax=Phytophthora fragariaefolia TaxID=1490495 RepID=A0A9W6WKP9_9STRA|nr:unnamed protein product [Phytophthora fragariaefolia]
MNVVGEGDAKLGLVSQADFSRFVSHVLVTAPSSSLAWAQISVESDRMSPKEIAAIAEKKLEKKLEIKVVDYEETKKNYASNPMAHILTRIGDGRCISGTEADVREAVDQFYPNWNPTPYEAVIASAAK